MKAPTRERRPMEPRHPFRRIWREARLLRPRAALKAVLDGYAENNLLTYASAISFQVFFALIPLVLFALGVLGLLRLEDVYREDIAPDIRSSVSEPVFIVVDDIVRQILGQDQLFWVTIGAAIAVWEISGAMRAIMGVFNSIYGVSEQRTFWRRMLVSSALAAAVGVLVLTAFVVARFGDAAIESALGDGTIVAFVGFMTRWAVTIALLLAIVATLGRFAPATRRPLLWGGFAALLVVVGWLGMSLIFAWYVKNVADYASIFGSLATVIVTMEYLYLSAIVFLTGIQLDSLIRRQVEGPGEPPGEALGPPREGRGRARSRAGSKCG